MPNDALASPVGDALASKIPVGVQPGEPRQRNGSPMPIKCLLILQSTTGVVQQVVDWLLDRIPN
ncbi:hypothetical protein [Nostoc sp.]|uniref:hypothetical protein n=1 Tax=Nostoc sp. TaxID=1180 RepID=UPI002FF8773E